MKLIMTICLFAIPVAVIAIIIKAAVDKKRKKNESNENTADKAEMKRYDLTNCACGSIISEI